MEGGARRKATSSTSDTLIFGGNFTNIHETHFYNLPPDPDAPRRRQDTEARTLVPGSPPTKGEYHFRPAQEGNHSTLNLKGQYVFTNETVAFDAMHSSAQRYPPPRCLPGTRDAVLAILTEWITSSNPSHSILWLYGTAGVGKSAIMQTLCETLSKEGGRVPAAFFFGRGQGQRERGELLASTLSFQLLHNLPGYKKGIHKVLARIPHLHTQSSSEQFSALLVDAIKASRRWSWWGKFFHSPITIVVDALGECKGEAVQATLIKTFHQVSQRTNYKVRFLVTSRPESHILVAFSTPEIAQSTKRIALDESFKPSDAIRFFLVTKFQEIAEAHQGKLPSVGWPGKRIIDTLVEAAGGQFIFVHLVIAFVSMPRRDPEQQLKIILDTKQNAIAFSALDVLYTQILDNIPPDQQLVLIRVLGCVVVLKEPLPITTIADLVSVDPSTAKLVLDQLRAVLSSNTMDASSLFVNPVRFAHTSFREYLIDRARSGCYAVDQSTIHSLLVQRYHEHLIQRHLQSFPTPPRWPTSFYALPPAASHYFNDEIARFHMKGCGKADEDPVLGTLRLYLRHEFKHIVSYIPNLHPPPGGTWPWEETIDIFAQAAAQQGRFGFLDLVSTLVQERLSCQDPQAELTRLLDQDQYQGSHLPIDILYKDLLNEIPAEKRSSLILILGCVTVAQKPLRVAALCDFTSLGEGDVISVLELLRPILGRAINNGATFHQPISFAHPSFRDYLVDSGRSGSYTIHQPTFHNLIVQRYHYYLIYQHMTRTRTASYGEGRRPDSTHTLSADASLYLQPQRVRFHVKAGGAADKDPAAGAIRLYLLRELEFIDTVNPTNPAQRDSQRLRQDIVNTFVKTADRQGALQLRFADTFVLFFRHCTSKCKDTKEYNKAILAMERDLKKKHPFDALYSRILDDFPPDTRPSLLPVLNCIALCEALPIATISAIASVDPSSTKTILDHIPLLSNHDPSSDPVFSPMKSLYDFLTDRHRARSHAVDLPSAHRQFFLQWLQMRFSPDSKPLANDDVARYLDEHFVFHGEAYNTGDLCQDLSRYIPENFDLVKFMDEMDNLTWLDWSDRILAGLQALLGCTPEGMV